jgi:hypothetical protein
LMSHSQESRSKVTTGQMPLSMSRVISTWWPLALGWLMMTAEIPLLTAVIARAPEPKINLAAWGVTFMMTVILGSPVMMLLPASTTLSKDWGSYVTLRRYMWGITIGVTVLHLLLVFTPLYDLIVGGLIGVPGEILEPARMGMILLIPWSGAIAYRRFNYGVLIRFGYARSTTVGVLVRLGTDAVVLTTFYLLGNFSGIAIAATTFCLGIVAEGVYSGIRVQPVLGQRLKQAAPVSEPITLRGFLNFYIPLVLTALLHVLVQPLTSAGLSRMPGALDSLAVWPVIFGLLIIFTSAGMAYTEVVVVLLDETQAFQKLSRFTAWLGIVTVNLLLVMAATPLAGLWFEYVAALPPALVPLASWGLWLTLPMPGLTVLQSWYQGILMHSKWTRSITESVVIFLAANAALLWAGVVWGQAGGIFVGMAAWVLGNLIRTAWLWYRVRPTMQAAQAREQYLPGS